MYVNLKVSDLDKLSENSDSVWVFGYGSLLWKPEFHYTSRETGFIKGFKRRFWQGNCTHRGTRDRPGRVVTIVEDSQEMVWGVAFKIEGPEKGRAIDCLFNREVTLGGYNVICTNFTSRDSSVVRTVIVYAATQSNNYYLGDSDLDIMSSEIVDAHGHAGSNVEYVVNLAEYCRNNIPEDNDPHLFDLERRVKALLKLRLNSTETNYNDENDFYSDFFDCDCDMSTESEDINSESTLTDSEDIDECISTDSEDKDECISTDSENIKESTSTDSENIEESISIDSEDIDECIPTDSENIKECT